MSDWRALYEAERVRLEDRLSAETKRREEQNERIDQLEREVTAERTRREQAERQADALYAQFSEATARAERAEADNAALRKVISATAVDAPGRVARVLDEHRPIITADHPGAALLDRMWALEALADAVRDYLAPEPNREHNLLPVRNALAALDALKVPRE